MRFDGSDRVNVPTESWGIFEIVSKAKLYFFQLFHRRRFIIEFGRVLNTTYFEMVRHTLKILQHKKYKSRNSCKKVWKKHRKQYFCKNFIINVLEDPKCAFKLIPTRLLNLWVKWMLVYGTVAVGRWYCGVEGYLNGINFREIKYIF